MTDEVQRRLFYHLRTAKALFVGTEASEGSGVVAWLPRSQVKEGETQTVYNHKFGQSVGVALMRGTLIRLTGPRWVFERGGLMGDATFTEEELTCPNAGRCPHGEPINLRCDDCVREHQAATA